MLPRGELYANEDEELMYFKYKKGRYEFQHLLDSFNNFLDSSIKQILSETTINYAGHQFTVEFRGVDYPTYSLQGVEGKLRLTKHVAMAHDKTYAGKVKVAISSGRYVSEEATLMEIPIMVYSNKCYDEHKKDDDPGCYFIIKGNRYFCFGYETGRNSFMVATQDPQGDFKVYCSVEYADTRTSYTVLKFDKNSVIGLRTNPQGVGYADDEGDISSDDEEGQQEEVIETDKTGKSVNQDVYTSVIMAGYIIQLVRDDGNKRMSKREFARHFLELVRSISPKDQFSRIRDKLSVTITEFNILDDDDVMRKMREILKVKPKDESIMLDLTREYFNQSIISHKSVEDKINYLALLTCKLCQVACGFASPTSRDYGFTRAVHAPGRSFAKVFSRKINGMIRSGFEKSHASDSLETMCRNLAQSIESLSPATSRKFVNSLLGINTGWSTGVTKATLMLVDVHNDTAMRALLTKTKNDANVNMGTLSAREVQSSYLFFKGILKFTDNDQCGFVKFLASMTDISVYVDPSRTISALKEGLTISLIKSTQIGKYTLPLYVSNALVGYVSKEAVGMISQMARSDYAVSVSVGDEFIGYVPNMEKFIRELRNVKVPLVEDKPTGEYTVPVTVNTRLIGYGNSKTCYRNLIMLKRMGRIDRKVAVVLSVLGVLELFTDGGRLMVPMLVVNREQKKLMIYTDEYKNVWKNMTFDQMVSRGIVEYLDGYEVENVGLTVAEGFGQIDDKLIEIEAYKLRLQILEQENNNLVAIRNYRHEIEIAEKHFYSYAPFHPLSIYAATTGELPYVNNHQACRSVYAEKIRGQAVGGGFVERGFFSSGFHTPYVRESHCSSMMAKYTGSREGTYGETLNAIIMPSDKNQEDAIIISQRVVDFGLRIFKTYMFSSTEEANEEFTRPELGKDAPIRMKFINATGAPTIGARYGPEDMIIGKIHRDGAIVRNVSLYMERHESGRVEQVLTYKNSKGQNVMKVMVRGYHTLEVGDKVSSREGQKHIVAEIREASQMPWPVNPAIGNVDVIMNSLSLITRMTIGSLYEFQGMAGALEGTTTDITGHRDYRSDIEKGKALLKTFGFNPLQKEMFVNPETGKMMTEPLFFGTMRLQQLYHLAEDKMQCRGHSSKDPLTRQAMMGKAKAAANKGQKLSAQERDKLLAYKSAFFVGDKMNIGTDGVRVVVCKVCSSWAHYSGDKFVCPTCTVDTITSPGESFYKYIEPQTSRYVRSLLLSIGKDIKPAFISKDEFLKKMGKKYVDES